jgi:poly(A) polymerase
VEVVRTLAGAGYTALWAGGCVRDLLLGRQPSDFDVATTATPEQVRNVFGKRRTLAVGESFGVVIVLGPKGAGQVEVATFRTEGPYADGRRPDSVAFATPEEDARRRDFTINGMFLDPLTDRVLDFVGGERDLQAGIVRAIGDPHARMTEDKLRMLRAVRFAATLDFELDETTAAAVREMAPQILVVSWERIAAELQKMLRHRHRRRAVRLTQQLGLLEQIVPELMPQVRAADDLEWTRTLNVLDRLETERFDVAAAVLLRALHVEHQHRRLPSGTGTVGSVARRLKLSNEQRAEIEWLVDHQHALDTAQELSLAQLKRLLAQPLMPDLIAIARAVAADAGAEAPGLRFVEAFLANTPAEELDPPPFITGADLVALGLSPGREFKVWLDEMRDLQLGGQVVSRDEALARLRRLVSTPASPSPE